MWDLCFRATSLVVFIALVSCRSQLDAFGGTKGLQPVAIKLSRIRLHLTGSSERPLRIREWLRLVTNTPTLLWLGDSDSARRQQRQLGVHSELWLRTLGFVANSRYERLGS